MRDLEENDAVVIHNIESYTRVIEIFKENNLEVFKGEGRELNASAYSTYPNLCVSNYKGRLVLSATRLYPGERPLYKFTNYNWLELNEFLYKAGISVSGFELYDKRKKQNGGRKLTHTFFEGK